MIISRYFAKEVLSTFFAVIIVLLLIFLSQQFVKYLGAAAAGKFPGLAVLELMALATPHVLGLLIPMALFLAILMTYGRFYVDSEMTVLSACGFSWKKLLAITLAIALVVAVLDAGLTLWLSPKISGMRNKILVNASSAMIVKTIMPGRFQATRDGSRVFYVESMSREDNWARNVFMAQKPRSKKAGKSTWDILSAQSAYLETKPKTHEQYIVATNGNRYFGNAGDQDYRMIHFGKYGVKMDFNRASKRRDQDEMSTLELLHAGSADPHNVAELHWRLAMPISVFILAILAVPLSRVNPRQGRYAKLLPSVLIYILYANMIIVGQDWIESGKIPVQFGMWWIHALFLVLALLMLAQPTLKNLKRL